MISRGKKQYLSIIYSSKYFKVILICIWILKSDHRPQTCVASGQTTTRDGVQTHTSADNCIKALLSKAPPTRARPSFSHASSSHQKAYTSLLASSIRGQTEEARKGTVSQRLKQTPYYRKLIIMKQQKVISQMKGQYKSPEKKYK